MFRGKYTWRELGTTDADLEDYDSIFRSNFDARDKELLRWRYQSVGPKESCLLVAEEQSKQQKCPAAFSALFGERLRVDGHIRYACQAIDSVTDKEHRGQGLFVWLAGQSYNLAKEKGVALVWGFPNANLRHAYPNHLSWTMLNPMPFIIRPMRTGYFAGMLARRAGFSRPIPAWLDQPLSPRKSARSGELKLKTLSRFGQDHDVLWKAFSQKIRVCVERDSEFLNWRIFDHPHQKYKVLGAYQGEELLAEVVWCLETKHGGRIGYIMELLHRPEHSEAGQYVLHAALTELAASECDAVLAWNVASSPNAATYSQAGFWPLPERVRPTNIYWGVRCFEESLREAVSVRSNWYISYTDSDTT